MSERFTFSERHRPTITPIKTLRDEFAMAALTALLAPMRPGATYTPEQAAQVIDIQRRHSLRRIQAALGFKDSIKTVSDGLRRAEAIVVACNKHLAKWPEPPQ